MCMAVVEKTDDLLYKHFLLMELPNKKNDFNCFKGVLMFLKTIIIEPRALKFS